MLKQNDVIEYTAENYTNAETVGKVGDVTVFVPYMLVGEKAIVKVNYAKKNIAYADVVKITKPSAKRQQAPCKHFGKCGGCTLMNMHYSEQLQFKRQKVQNNLQKIAGLNFPVLPCVASKKTLGYRNKLSLPVRCEAGNVKIGMYQKSSHNIVDMQDCLLGDSWSSTLLEVFRSYLNNAKIAPYDEKEFSGEIRHLVARYIDGQLLVTVVSNGKWTADLQPLSTELSKHFEKFGLFVNENNYKNNVILGENTRHVCGLHFIESQHLGIKFRLHPDSFFQVNNEIKNGLYQKVKELLNLSQTQILVDCFSGVGILTNVLANENFQTYAVEIVPEAVKDAQENAKINNSPNIINICGDANAELPKITSQHSDKVMTLVVDPPRKGLGETLCETILKANFDNIVYISCDSATLARDLAWLSQCYSPDYIQPWDMFPQTAEVETLVHLRRI